MRHGASFSLTTSLADGIVVLRQREKGDVKKSAMGNQYLLTTKKYLARPETLVPTELIYGSLRVADAPLAHHQRAVRDLCFAMVEHAESRHLGEVLFAPLDVILDVQRALVVQPDLLFVSNERRHIVADRIYGAPDLVVEIISPVRGSANWASGLAGLRSTACGSAGWFTNLNVVSR